MLVLLLGSLPMKANADCGSYDNTYNIRLARLAMKDYYAYTNEGNDDLAKASLDNAQHELDLVSFSDMFECDDHWLVAEENVLEADVNTARMNRGDDKIDSFNVNGLRLALAVAYNNGAAKTHFSEYSALKARLRDFFAKIHHKYHSPESRD